MRNPNRMASRALVIVSFIAACVLYAFVPDQIPSHWNAKGEIDGYMPKSIGLLAMPATMLLTYGFYSLILMISPRGFEIVTFRSVFEVLRLATLSFLLWVTVAVFLAALAVHVDMNVWMFSGGGVLMLVFGNFLGKVRKNFFIGIRTPWTLASDEVWLRTHRFGRATVMLGGATILVGSWLGLGLVGFFVVLISAIVVPAIYSYIIYRSISAA